MKPKWAAPPSNFLPANRALVSWESGRKGEIAPGRELATSLHQRKPFLDRPLVAPGVTIYIAMHEIEGLQCIRD